MFIHFYAKDLRKTKRKKDEEEETVIENPAMDTFLCFINASVEFTSRIYGYNLRSISSSALTLNPDRKH